MTNPEIHNNEEQEPKPKQQLIADALPRYYEVHGENPRYETVRSMMMDGHEVAWMEYRGEVAYDITGRGREGQAYVGRTLRCTCDFTEHCGWEEKGEHLYSLDGGEKCLPKKAALHLRRLELRTEYMERFKSNDRFKTGTYALWDHIPEIILDLIEKHQDGEFLEASTGAEFWGGHFYLQTVAAITEKPIGELWAPVGKMVKEKKIGLEGAVIQSYFEPAPPSWEPHSTYELNGWKATAGLPTHSKMPQMWKFEVTKPDGEKLDLDIPGEYLTHSPDFGPDVDDVNHARERLVQILEQIMHEQG